MLSRLTIGGIRMEWPLSDRTDSQQREIWQDAYQRVLDVLDQLRGKRSQDETTDLDLHLASEFLIEHERMVAICLGLNKPQEAWQHAQEVYRLARKLKDIRRIGFAKRTLGDMLSAIDVETGAHATQDVDLQYEGALLAFRSANVPIEVARTLVAHGRSLRKRDKRQAAASRFQQAAQIFNHFGAEREAQQAQLFYSQVTED